MFKHCLIVFLVSMVPIIELRGAIPYGVGFGLPLWLTYIVAIVGNMLPVPLIYFFARRILEWGQDKPVIGKFFTFCLEKGKKGGEKLQAKAGRGLFWALLLFVGIPRQSPGYGFPQECAGLYGRRTAGRMHHGRPEPAGCLCLWGHHQMTGFIREKDLPEGGTSLRSASFGQPVKEPPLSRGESGGSVAIWEK